MSRARPITTPLCFLLLTVRLSAAPPIDLGTLAPVDELVIEVHAQIALIEKLLTDETTFQGQQDKSLRQAFGLLAVLGQALAEHPQGESAGVPGAPLRAAAQSYDHKADYAAAQTALANVQAALAGEYGKEAAIEHPWNRLVRMHPMMEEMNGRNSAILRVLRRPRGNPQESAHATVWVVLGAAMKADTHEVKDPADLPQWDAWSDEFLQSAARLGEAIRAKDRLEARTWFDKANQACDACHEKFRDQ